MKGCRRNPTMKRIVSTLCIILLFILMLVFPQAAFQGASAGLILWFQTVLPTLLPFFILSNLLIQTGAIDWIAMAISPVLCRFFRVSPYGAFTVLTGFLCGCPMGSKVTADLLRNGCITRQEGCYLLSFCNNTSPMFMISFVIWQNLQCSKLTYPLLAILLLSPVLLSFLFRRYYRIPREIVFAPQHFRKPDAEAVRSEGMLDGCMMNGFETVTRIGGYMMLFSIILSLAQTFPLKSFLLSSVLLPSLEITTGINMICGSDLAASARIIRSLALTSFGGWCAAAQTKAMIADAPLPFLPYIIEKLAAALVTSLLVSIFLLLY